MNVNISTKQKKFIIPIIILIIILITALFLLKGRDTDKELDDPINTPISSISDIKLSVPDMTDAELQEELNREMTDEEQERFIANLTYLQEEKLKLEEASKHLLLEDEDGNLYYESEELGYVYVDTPPALSEEIENMTDEEFDRYLEQYSKQQEKSQQEIQEFESTQPSTAEVIKEINSLTDEQRQQIKDDTGMEYGGSTDDEIMAALDASGSKYSQISSGDPNPQGPVVVTNTELTLPD